MNGRPPPHPPPQKGVVTVPATFAWRASEVMSFPDSLRGDVGNQVHQSIDRDQLIGAQVERFAVLGCHDANQSFHAIVPIHKRAGLPAVTPILDLISTLGQGDLPGDGCRSLFFSTVIGTERAINIVEADNARLKPRVLIVVMAKLLGKELLPAV